MESDELSGCGSGIFCMVAQTLGVKRFRLPKGRRPGEVLAGPSFEVLGGGVYSVKMNIGEIFVLAYRQGLRGAEAANQDGVRRRRPRVRTGHPDSPAQADVIRPDSPAPPGVNHSPGANPR